MMAVAAMAVTVMVVAATRLQVSRMSHSTGRWMHSEDEFRSIMASHSKTDKATLHEYDIMYHRLLVPLVLQKQATRRKLRMLEIGLGCGFMKPGGSVAM